MGTSRNSADFAKKLGRVTAELSQVPKVAVNRAAGKVDRVFFMEANKSIGGTQLAGRKWGTTVKTAKSNVNAQALVKYRGPVHWFESGTKRHTIVSRKFGGSKASRGSVDIPGRPWVGMYAGTRRRGAIRTPQGMRAYAEVAGMKPRPFFGRVKAKAPDIAVRELKTATTQAIVKGLR